MGRKQVGRKQLVTIEYMGELPPTHVEVATALPDDVRLVAGWGNRCEPLLAVWTTEDAAGLAGYSPTSGEMYTLVRFGGSMWRTELRPPWWRAFVAAVGAVRAASAAAGARPDVAAARQRWADALARIDAANAAIRTTVRTT